MNLLDLPWLQAVPSSFRTDLKAIRDGVIPAVPTLRALAMSALDLTQLTSLSRVLASRLTELPGSKLKLGILSNATTDLLPPAIMATGLRHHLLVEIQTSSFGSFVQDALDPASALNTARNDFVLLALDYRAFGFDHCLGDVQDGRRLVEAALERLSAMIDTIHTNSGATVIVQTLADSPDNLFGSFESRIEGSLSSIIGAFNESLLKRDAPGSIVLDVARLAAQVGSANWHDPSVWFSGKFSCAHAAVPLYAEHVCRILMAARGKARKCLVLDLDNTLWSGVIGDDGMAGIVLGQGSAVGEAHLAVQAAALALRARGVVLAVSSKNDEAVARKVFQEHPDMLIREQHIAVFQANWQDKASNLRAIAETLNIGLDSLVFVDDNPAERQQIRLALPMVAVPELPDQPEQYASLLLAAGYFETLQFTAEDGARAEQYQANAARKAVLGTASNLDSYLQSLEMVADIAPFDELGRARITQLINKTNQFNLTTERLSESQVAAIEHSDTMLGLQIRLRDRFGDNGMIGVVICDTSTADWRITTWLMSCRVLNRKVEAAVLDTLAATAVARGAANLIGLYVTTDRNGMVSDHYRKLGFESLDCGADGSTWRLPLASYAPVNPAIEIRLHPSLSC